MQYSAWWRLRIGLPRNEITIFIMFLRETDSEPYPDYHVNNLPWALSFSTFLLSELNLGLGAVCLRYIRSWCVVSIRGIQKALNLLCGANVIFT